MGYSCPLPPFAANQSTSEPPASIAFGCFQLGIIRLIINVHYIGELHLIIIYTLLYEAFPAHIHVQLQ